MRCECVLHGAWLFSKLCLRQHTSQRADKELHKELHREATRKPWEVTGDHGGAAGGHKEVAGNPQANLPPEDFKRSHTHAPISQQATQKPQGRQARRGRPRRPPRRPREAQGSPGKPREAQGSPRKPKEAQEPQDNSTRLCTSGLGYSLYILYISLFS